VLSTAPSLRSDNPPSYGNLPKALRWRGPETLRHGENIMTVLLGYFLIAAIAGVATSATIVFVLTSLLIARIDKGGRPGRIKNLITSFGGSR
jgi:hypothetical protein